MCIPVTPSSCESLFEPYTIFKCKNIHFIIVNFIVCLTSSNHKQLNLQESKASEIGSMKLTRMNHN